MEHPDWVPCGKTAISVFQAKRSKMSLGSCRGRVPFSCVIVGTFIVLITYYIYSESTPGVYSQWTKWSFCTSTCGQGWRGRIRKCVAPKPGIFGKECKGKPLMTDKCPNLKPCPIDGGLTEWSKFGSCDKTCGGGVKKRTRSCTNPKPEYGGKTCEENSVETMVCGVQPCHINGGFSDWGEYSKCELTGDITCGKGKHVRTRSCNKPVPQHGGKSCDGKESESAECEIPCPTTSPKPTTNKTTKYNNATLAPTTAKA